jgi:ABC-type antimicrobial peptide transport system permease subunit
VLI